MNKQLFDAMEQRLAAKRLQAERARAGVRLEYLPADLEHREFQRMLQAERTIF